MFGLTTKTRAVAVVAAFGLLAAAGPALAHGGPHGPHGARGPRGAFAPVTGTIAAVSAGSVQVTTASGPVTLNLTSSTHVMRDVKATTADLAANEMVRLTLTSGTTTVTSVTIMPAPGTRRQGTRPAPSGTPRPHPTFVGTPRPRPQGTHTPKAPHAALNHGGGKVVSISGNTLVVAGPKNTQTTYTLSASVTVTRVVAGTISNLAVGQNVVVVKDPAGNAREILIFG